MPLFMTFLLGLIRPNQTDLVDDTKRLVRSKLDSYDKTRSVLPKSDPSTPIVITVEAFLLNILYVKETEDSITTYMFFNLQWTDKQLAWNKSEFSNVECIWLPYKNVWLPDLVVINTINNSKPSTHTAGLSDRVPYWAGILVARGPTADQLSHRCIQISIRLANMQYQTYLLGFRFIRAGITLPCKHNRVN